MIRPATRVAWGRPRASSRAGVEIPVLRYFGDPKKPAVAAESRFLRTLANRLFDENVCSVVVTRFYDELHRDHIHCDMAHYHVDGSR